MTMKKIFLLLFIALLGNAAIAQITDYSIFDKKFNFYVANDLGRNGYYDQKPIAELMGQMAEEVGPEFVLATGDVHHFKNRNELKAKIESLGGKVSGSVSSKTSYLINNDSASASSKNKKAKELGVKIISEDEFLSMLA